MKRFGIEIRKHADLGTDWIFVDAGKDPIDGQPCTFARQAFSFEVQLWRSGKHLDLARMLASQGLPVKLPAERRHPRKRRRL
jgi:hypothetical protein